eukprot:1185614-Prorocentrum_minimum.AAC.3
MTSPGVDCRPAMWQSAGNIRRIFGRIFEMPCAEWYTVELKSKAFWPSTPGLGCMMDTRTYLKKFDDLFRCL